MIMTADLSNQWLLSNAAIDSLSAMLDRRDAPTALQLAGFQASIDAEVAEGSSPRLLQVAGSTAQIRIEGPMTPVPSAFMRWLGIPNTGYSEIRSAVATALADPKVSSIEFFIDSPGGTVAGLFETVETLLGAEKPMHVIGECVCSGAYALAATIGKITANNRASVFGSIGVVATFKKYSDIEVINITSTEAPDKRPDPSTENGKAVIVAQLDEVHVLFVDVLAEGRTGATGEQVTVKTVNETFGRGTTMLAASALAAGMIDAVPKKPKAAVRGAAVSVEHVPGVFVDGLEPGEEPRASASNGVVTSADAQTITAALAAAQPTAAPAAPMEGPMDLKTLKAQHRDVYQAAYDEGAAAALEDERDRVGAHLEYGKSSGAMSLAVDAVITGKKVTQTLLAQYNTAGINSRETSNHQADSDEADSATDVSSAGASDEMDEQDRIAAEMDNQFGEVS